MEVCTTKVQNWYKPVFSELGQGAGSYWQIPCGREWERELPVYIDAFGKRAYVEVKPGDTEGFIEWDPSVRKFIITQTDRNKLRGGMYSIDYTIYDTFRNYEERTIKVELQCWSFLDNLLPGQKPLVSFVPPNDTQTDPPIPILQRIDQFGRVRVTFDRPMWLPTFKEYPEFLEYPQLMEKNCTDP